MPLWPICLNSATGGIRRADFSNRSVLEFRLETELVPRLAFQARLVVEQVHLGGPPCIQSRMTRFAFGGKCGASGLSGFSWSGSRPAPPPSRPLPQNRNRRRWTAENHAAFLEMVGPDGTWFTSCTETRSKQESPGSSASMLRVRISILQAFATPAWKPEGTGAPAAGRGLRRDGSMRQDNRDTRASSSKLGILQYVRRPIARGLSDSGEFIRYSVCVGTAVCARVPTTWSGSAKSNRFKMSTSVIWPPRMMGW